MSSRFPFLIDEPADGYMEDTAWLPADAASSPDEAVEEFTRRYREESGVHPLDERNDISQLVCAGRVFEQPHVTRFSEVERETTTCATCGHRAVAHTGGCTMSTVRGASVSRCSCPAFVASVEYLEVEEDIVGAAAWAAVDAGDAYEEDVRYRTCEPDADGAEEFWRIEVEALTAEVPS